MQWLPGIGTDFVVNLGKLIFFQFGKILIHVLVWQIATQENTMHRAILTLETLESSGSFPLLEELV